MTPPLRKQTAQKVDVGLRGGGFHSGEEEDVTL